MPPSSHYLRPEDIRKLGTFEFAPKALVEGFFAGRHRSLERGSSIEFRDYRPFVDGDDRALVDWRCFARTDRYYVRTYEQETTMECTLFLDSSASMGFGGPVTKLEYASFFTAALAYLVVRGKDRVSLHLFDREIREFFPPGSTTKHLNNLLAALERNRPGSQTSLATALQRAYPLLRRKGTLIVVSDFFDDPAAIFQALNPYLHRGFKVHLFHVLDPAELELADKGLVSFQDLETGERLVAHTDNLRGLYRDAIAEHIHNLRSLSRRRGVDYVPARTDQHFFNLFDHLVT